MMPGTLKSDKGSAVVIVIVITMILMASGFYFIATAKQTVKTTSQLMDKLDAWFKAESAVEIVKFYGSTGTFSVRSLRNILYSEMKYPEKFDLGGDEYITHDQVSIKLQDAGAFIDTYFAIDSSIITRLLQQKNSNLQDFSIIKDSLDDWFDPNIFHRLNGAEKSYYNEQGNTFEPRNYYAPQDIYELSLIRGLDEPELFNQLTPYLIFRGGKMFNLNTLNQEMLQAVLDIDEDTAAMLIQLRDNKGYIDSLDIDRVIGISGYDINDIAEFYPDRKLVLKVKAASGDAVKKIRSVIDFNPEKNRLYTVLEYIN